MPAEVATTRKSMCIRAGCTHDDSFYFDPCSACKVAHWGTYSADCAKVARPPRQIFSGGSTDHEKEAAMAGQVPECCGSGNERRGARERVSN